MQTSKGKAPHTFKELMRRIIAFEFQKRLLLKSSQNEAASNIAISGKRKKSKSGNHTCQGHFEIKLLIVVKCDVSPIKDSFLDGDKMMIANKF